MIIDRLTDQHVLHFQGSPLSLIEGQLQQFEYTPTIGEAPMSFRAEFSAGYTAQFSCIARNSLCPQGVFCGFGGYFTGEGEYEIKDCFNQIADRGTFSLKYPVYHNNTMPEPDESIQDLGQPAQEFSKILALVSGPDGRPLAVADLVTAPDGKIYGSTAYRDGILNNYYAHLFVYNPQADSIIYLGSPLSNQAGIGSLSFSEDGTLWGVILSPAENSYKEPLGKIFSYDPGSNLFTVMDSQFVNVSVRALTIGKGGLFYVAGSGDMNKIYTYNPASGLFEVKGSLCGNAFVMDMMCGSEGTIYIGSGCNGYFIHYNPEKPWDDKPYSGYIDTPDINPRMFRWTGMVNCMTEEHDGSIYFGTLDGHIYVFTSEEEAIEEPQAEEPIIRSVSLHVLEIEPAIHEYGQIMGAVANVLVVDETGSPVQGAAVSGSWSGLVSADSLEFYTDADGVASIACPGIEGTHLGEFCFTITEITKAQEWIYTPDVGIENIIYIYLHEADAVSNCCIHPP